MTLEAVRQLHRTGSKSAHAFVTPEATLLRARARTFVWMTPAIGSGAGNWTVAGRAVLRQARGRCIRLCEIVHS